MDARLRGFFPEVYDHQIALNAFHPAPSEKILAALVVRPAAPFAETPLPISENITIRLFQ